MKLVKIFSVLTLIFWFLAFLFKEPLVQTAQITTAVLVLAIVMRVFNIKRLDK
ncbi:hypothetical protein [Dokdonia sinensis]|uniref:hypothetical protein n=1 Tax=Dokdonia sinensis TaxID=2479847 RepID=UPI001374B247|nr:hypothetical protein [Dokdonia sinensis]